MYGGREMQNNKSLYTGVPHREGQYTLHVYIYLRLSATADMEVCVNTPSGKMISTKVGRHDPVRKVKTAVQATIPLD